jgi:hypothetical protein
MATEVSLSTAVVWQIQARPTVQRAKALSEMQHPEASRCLPQHSRSSSIESQFEPTRHTLSMPMIAS